MSSMTSIDINALDPQQPLPMQAAMDYANTALGWAQQTPESLILARNVAYGADPAQNYDVFGDPQSRQQPTLIFLHGGGWTHGYKEWCAFMAEPVARLGMRLVTPNYRLAPQHRFPAAYEDCLASLHHFYEHAAQFGADPSHIYLAGHSAGGHLALLTALRRAEAGIPNDSIRACLPISGILDLHHPDPAPGSLEEAVYAKVLREPLDDAPMSPLSWGAGNTLPVLLSYGEHDTARVRLSNQRMAAMLALQPAEIQLHCEPGLDHFATHLSLRDSQAPWYERLARLAGSYSALPRRLQGSSVLQNRCC
ncbi:alpha/beta hydrolase [Comamonas sp.]|uniref:alpha/beta hydrolase n=1 Tax=Comamonas sp. TaxID=34028 RepID=UPI0026471079|nr:alpha/beta hydrolase fold domain-containing protein [Comamonas sp.]MDN5540680.1 alpha/beta hydrolase [Comamonas sp.]